MMRHTKLRIDDILTEGVDTGSFSFAFEPAIGELVDSIKKVGLVNPPTLRQGKKGIEVVCGFKRVLACKSMGLSEIDARVYEEGELSDEQCLWFSLIDNAQPGHLSPVECAIALRKFFELDYDSGRLTEEIAPHLGLPPSKRYIENCLQLLSLDKEIMRAVHDGSLGVEQGFCMCEVESESRVGIFWVVQTCRANLNETRELVSLIPDVAAIRGMSVSAFITDELGPLLDDDSPPRKKLQSVRDDLMRARYPRLTDAERAFNAVIERMNLGKEFTINAPKHFEGNEISLTIRAHSGDHLKGILMKLSSTEVEQGFEELFSILRGSEVS
jgi:ParB family chromosome partitioning protein